MALNCSFTQTQWHGISLHSTSIGNSGTCPGAFHIKLEIPPNGGMSHIWNCTERWNFPYRHRTAQIFTTFHHSTQNSISELPGNCFYIPRDRQNPELQCGKSKKCNISYGIHNHSILQHFMFYVKAWNCGSFHIKYGIPQTAVCPTQTTAWIFRMIWMTLQGLLDKLLYDQHSRVWKPHFI